MKIGIVTDNLPWEGLGGGIGTYTVLVAGELARRGHDVHVFRWRYDSDYSVEQRGDDVTYHLCPKWVSVKSRQWKHGLRLQIASRNDPALAETIILESILDEAGKNQPFDLVEFPEFEGYGKAGLNCKRVKRTAVRMHGCSKLVRHFAGEPLDAPLDQTDRLERNVALACDALTSVSQSALDATQDIWSVKLPKAVVVPNPIERMIEGDVLPERSRSTLFFAGRLEQRKGIDTLALALPKILEHVPDLQVQIFGRDKEWAGGGTGSSKVEEVLVKYPKLASAVCLFGAVTRQELLEKMREATLVVVPSTHENQPFAVLEAIALGSPLVLTDIEAHREIITGPHMGALFAAGNPEDLACQAIALLTDDERRTVLSKGALARSRDFEVAPVTDRLLSAWGFAA